MGGRTVKNYFYLASEICSKYMSCLSFHSPCLLKTPKDIRAPFTQSVFFPFLPCVRSGAGGVALGSAGSWAVRWWRGTHLVPGGHPCQLCRPPPLLSRTDILHGVMASKVSLSSLPTLGRKFKHLPGSFKNWKKVRKEGRRTPRRRARR